MRTAELRRGLLGVGLVGLLVATVLAGAPTDVAQYLPAETGVYVGWRAPADPCAPLAIGARLHVALEAAQRQAGGGQRELPAALQHLPDLVDRLTVANVGIGLFDVKLPPDGPPQFGAAAVCDMAPGEAVVLADLVQQLATDARAAVTAREVAGTPFQAVRLGEGLELLWGAKRDVFILALGTSSAERVLACLAGQAPGLTSAAEFVLQRQTLGVETAPPLACAYVAPPRVLEWVQTLAERREGGLPPIVMPALRELGITAIRSAYVHVDGPEAAVHWRGFVHVEGEFKGLLKIWDQAPLQEADLQLLPHDAYWAYVTKLDLKGLYNETVRVLNELDPEAAANLQGGMAAGSTVTGFSLTEQLLPVFGDTWALYDAPSHGGLLATGTVLVADVKDSEALQGMLGRFVQMAGAAAAGKAQVGIKQAKHGDHVVHYVQVGDLPVPVSPAWGYVGGRWVCGLWPQTVAAALAEVDPKTRGETLPDRADVRAARVQLPKSAQAFSYCDNVYFTRLLYPVTNAVQTLLCSQLRMDIDLQSMPPVAEATRGITNSVGVTRRERDGIRMESIGNAAAVPVVVGGTALTTSIMLPSLARAREISKRAVSAANLRGIGQAIKIYANDNADKYPPALTALIEDGSITEKQLISPRQPSGVTSYVYITGQSENSDPRNVLAYERLEGQEGTNLLFCDGHVEWQRPEAMRKSIRETYRRLQREQELPREFRE